jgi:hypothetical protein
VSSLQQEFAYCTWVQQICNCFAWPVQEHIRPFSSAYKIASDWAPVNDAWIHALYLVLWENNYCLAIVPNLDIFQRPAAVPWRTVRFPGFVIATAPRTYVWSFRRLPWPQGRPICIKSSVFLWQISTTRRAKKGGCDRYKGHFWKKWAQVATSWRTKVWNQHFRPLAPISHQFIGGIPTFSTSLFLLAKFGDILLWKIANQPTSQIWKNQKQPCSRL